MMIVNCQLNEKTTNLSNKINQSIIDIFFLMMIDSIEINHITQKLKQKIMCTPDSNDKLIISVSDVIIVSDKD